MLYYTTTLLLLFFLLLAPNSCQKSKLCGNDKCSEPLFTSAFKRSYNPPDERFMNAEEGKVVKVYAIKFSDRTDIMEGEVKEGQGRS